MNETDWDRIIDVNLKGVFLMCQAVGRHMIKRRYAIDIGAAIFLASEAASYVTGHDLIVDGGYTIW